MLGAIVGDIVGSVYEWNNIKTKEFPLFRDDCFFTDDTVMTAAVAEALMNGGDENDFVVAFKKFGRRYPNAGYGSRFGSWIQSEQSEPYNSWGNGSAMRVSPAGFYVKLSGDLDGDVRRATALASASARVTHNHPEGIKGANAVAETIVVMRYSGQDEKEISRRKRELRVILAEKYGYNLSRSLDEIRPDYRFDESCRGTVPQALTAFFESCDFEDAVRNAVSLGGDSDTLAAITAGIAEAAYGVPAHIMDKAWSYLDEPIRDVCRRWAEQLQQT